MELIREIIIRDPPVKYTINLKKPKYDKDGKLITKQEFYLTGNLFYSDRTSYHITSKIIVENKRFLLQQIGRLPEIEKMRLDFEYHKMQHIDLDNKTNFWCKLFLDVLKTPTPLQERNANLKKKDIITLRCIPDDNTKHVTEINTKFVLGEHCMIFRIYGRLRDTQEQLFYNV